MRTLFHPRSFLLAAMAVSALLGCSPGAEGDPASADEQTAEANSALTTTMVATSAADTLKSTNGTKVITGRYGNLHAVYAEGGNIKYITSADGVTWTAPVVIASISTSQPVIAEDSAGTLGVVYLKSGTLYYVKKLLSGSWSAPIFVSTDSFSRTSVTNGATMVAYGTTMHIAWANGNYVFYASLPSTATAPTSASETVNLTTLCATYSVSFPSIAVTPQSATNSAPRIRVGYHEFEHPDLSCGGGTKFGMFVSERSSGGTFWNILRGGTSAVTSATPISMSLASVPATGDFYVAYSWVVDSLESTTLSHQNAWTASSWNSTSLLTRRSVVDVSVNPRDCDATFRVALSDYTMGSGNFGPTWYRTGTWTGAAAAPTWIDPTTITVNTGGRNAEALLWQKSFGSFSSGYTRRVPTAYEQLVSGAYSIVDEATTSPGWPAIKACSKTAANARMAACVHVSRATGSVVADTQIASNHPNKSWGTRPFAVTGTQKGGRTRNALFRFDVADIPKDASVTSAAVTLTRTGSGGGLVGVHRVAAPWKEASVTWANFQGAYSEDAAASFESGPPGADGPVSFDVTELAQGWVSGKEPNFGVLLEQDGPFTSFATSESADPDAQPQLDICYVP